MFLLLQAFMISPSKNISTTGEWGPQEVLQCHCWDQQHQMSKHPDGCRGAQT